MENNIQYYINMENFDLTRILEMVFLSIMTGSIAWSAKFLQRISKSICQLNNQVGVILEKLTWHEKAIAENSQDIKEIKKKFTKGH